jgi:hypothetical protein
MIAEGDADELQEAIQRQGRQIRAMQGLRKRARRHLRTLS